MNDNTPSKQDSPKSKQLFDSSSIVNLAVFGGEKALDVVRNGGSILALTYYEVGNAIWKMHHLTNKINRDDASSLLQVSMKLLALLETVECSTDEATEIEDLAFDQKLTFYDASYLFVAKKHHLTLVSDDGKMSKTAARQKVDTITSSSLIQSRSESRAVQADPEHT